MGGTAAARPLANGRYDNGLACKHQPVVGQNAIACVTNPGAPRLFFVSASGEESTLRVVFVMAAAVAALAIAACSESAAPSELTCPSAAVPLCAKEDSTVAAVASVTTDAGTRSLGALANPAARTALATELAAIDAAIDARNVTQARAAVERTRTALASAREQLSTHPGDAPDLAAIELALVQVARALQ